MFFSDAGYYGMHYSWWFFWIIVWFAYFAFLTPVRRGHWKRINVNPLDLLQQRLATGEIKEEEYNRLKMVIERDRQRDFDEKNSSHSVTNKFRRV